jgi:hypothetical protein
MSETQSIALFRRTAMRVLKHSTEVGLLGFALLLAIACSPAREREGFASPDDAAKALQGALKADDQDRLRKIFGRDAVAAVASGDPIADRHDREVIALAMEQSWRWNPLHSDRQELIIGDEQWPFPAPLVKQGNEWQFDGKAAEEEILARRIGRNELNVIGLCSSYVRMQSEYSSRPRDGKPAGLYARRLRSTPGHQDGLYWPTKPGERRSPMGDLIAAAASDGYAEDKAPQTPFWGYRFRILSTPADASTGGHALLAYPAVYSSSGVMTFIVSQDGVVREKDLGPETTKLAQGLTELNPDSSWLPVSVR